VGGLEGSPIGTIFEGEEVVSPVRGKGEDASPDTQGIFRCHGAETAK